jgi:hypothetical protein
MGVVMVPVGHRTVGRHRYKFLTQPAADCLHRFHGPKIAVMLDCSAPLGLDDRLTVSTLGPANFNLIPVPVATLS